MYLVFTCVPAVNIVMNSMEIIQMSNMRFEFLLEGFNNKMSVNKYNISDMFIAFLTKICPQHHRIEK